MWIVEDTCPSSEGEEGTTNPRSVLSVLDGLMIAGFVADAKWSCGGGPAVWDRGCAYDEPVQSDQLVKEIPSSAPGMYVYRSI